MGHGVFCEFLVQEKVAKVGGASAAMASGHQELRSGSSKLDDIALSDPAEWHHYQQSWTLVGGGLEHKDWGQRLSSLVDPSIRLNANGVQTVTLILKYCSIFKYLQLIIRPGIKVAGEGKPDRAEGLDTAVQMLGCSRH
ncbi:hypothetical protein S7711_08261 [Stachybotrys chartarum IBT 7711]|uniref:Uncharacterized protein n=1 Tax=Stachybotrys chartarum (strain CBS 109288 / IBT 7711) TaxID=1280523 RepID=A0A084AQK9_STACB|nr:hypothetical protein S7711_08261 [Stachybotrys chartarum IBT 7711]KFA56063.1 hypothetical protein S40293_00171 [Stachybotrys chartarum IBT 40293]KFA72074.1 hypothetical protein S40288_02275 [Stachybotrys chartarum IBT 40288]